MKKLILFCYLILLYIPHYFTQTFYNGSFENDSAAVCTFSLNNPDFNAQMSHVRAFGSTDNGYFPDNTKKPSGRISIQDSDCYVVPSHGKWCIGLRSLFGSTHDAIALELDAPLDSGTTYYVSFYCYGNKSFQNFDCDLNVGYSPYNFLLGTTVHTVTANYLVWKNTRFSFIARDTSRYITVNTVPGYNSWIQVDNFEISKNPIPVGIEHYAARDFFKVYPNPASDFLRLDFTEDRSRTSVEISNELGQKLLYKQMDQVQTTTIDLHYFPVGFYTLRVSSDGASVCKKLVIAK